MRESSLRLELITWSATELFVSRRYRAVYYFVTRTPHVEFARPRNAIESDFFSVYGKKLDFSALGRNSSFFDARASGYACATGTFYSVSVSTSSTTLYTPRYVLNTNTVYTMVQSSKHE